MIPLLAALVVVGLVGLLLAERAGRVGVAFASKTLASGSFVAMGWIAHAPPWILVALALSLAGDLLLVPRDHRVFRAGILVFLLAHVAFVVAFLRTGLAWTWALGASVALAVVAALVARRLLPHVPPPLRAAVVAYVVVITVMVAAAAGTRRPEIVAAAALFWANDLLVARDRFVARAFANRLAGLPMYYGAQVLFALSA